MSETTTKQQPDKATYLPKQALVVFATDAARNGQHSKYYIEVSDVTYDKGRSFIGAGKPLTKETLQTLMGIVAEGDRQTFFSVTNTVPTNLLVIDQRVGRNVIAWWKPAQRQTIVIKNKRSITNWVPPMVFVVRNNRLAVATLTKSRRPTINTRLHHAPFFNVYKDMKVCLGNVKPPKTSGDITELMTAWEHAFWRSEFTDLVSGAYTKKDLETWWRKKRRGKFNLKKLKQSQLNLRLLCENL